MRTDSFRVWKWSLCGLEVLCLLLPFASCRHKELCYDYGAAVRLDLRFDWRFAPDAFPDCMEVFFFPDDGSEPLYYQFQGRDGGSVRLAPGAYRIVVFNGDCSSLNYSYQPMSYEHFRVAASELSPSYVLPPHSDVNLRKTEMLIQDVVSPMDMLWSARDALNIPQAEDSVMERVMYPEKVLRTYAVKVGEVKNLSQLRSVYGTLTGMSGACYIGLENLDNQKVTVPFPMEFRTPQSLFACFYTFGPEVSLPRQHELNLFARMDDGCQYQYSYDVTAQILSAEDPWNVLIQVDSLPLPQLVQDNGNFMFSIEDWLSNEVPVKL